MWFRRLTGFHEESPEHVRENISVDREHLTSKVNGRSYRFGKLETPSLGDLRSQAGAGGSRAGKTSVREVVADTKDLHRDAANAGALFQVASQFNLLEMVSPDVTPEMGVARYGTDPTQGPACAVAAGAGTIYRNYFVPVRGQTGQTARNQIDCLEEVGAALGNSDNRLWQMRNGYALVTREGLEKIAGRLEAASDAERDDLRQLLRIGIQWQTEVTIAESGHTVSQAFCSALPVAYSPHRRELWAPFALLVLEAAYEATLCAGVLNRDSQGNNTVFLTLVGGGAFGNDPQWIASAIRRAVGCHRDSGLDIRIVSYRRSNPQVQALVEQCSG
jgi:hypothetical protein